MLSWWAVIVVAFKSMDYRHIHIYLPLYASIYDSCWNNWWGHAESSYEEIISPRRRYVWYSCVTHCFPNEVPSRSTQEDTSHMWTIHNISAYGNVASDRKIFKIPFEFGDKTFAIAITVSRRCVNKWIFLVKGWVRWSVKCVLCIEDALLNYLIYWLALGKSEKFNIIR